jgi:hypothetical protein
VIAAVSGVLDRLKSATAIAADADYGNTLVVAKFPLNEQLIGLAEGTDTSSTGQSKANYGLEGVGEFRSVYIAGSSRTEGRKGVTYIFMVCTQPTFRIAVDGDITVEVAVKTEVFIRVREYSVAPGNDRIILKFRGNNYII